MKHPAQAGLWRRRQWLAAALGTACAVPAWPLAAQAKAGQSTIAAVAGVLPAPGRVRRVFAAGPPAAVLLAVLSPAQLMGWPMRLSDDARSYLGDALAGLPFLGRLSGRGSTMPLESLLALQPDLVVDAGTADATYVSAIERLASQTGLPCLLVQGSLADHGRQLREVGALLDVSPRAETLAQYADEVAALTDRVTASLAPQARPAAFLGRGANGLETGLAGSINVEVLDYAGAHNVAASAGQGGLARVSMEQMLAWDPEVIVTQEAGFAAQIRRDPVWRGIRAVRDGRVHLAPMLPFGWLDGPPGVNRLIGVRWLLEKLHPGHPALRGLPPMETEVREFHALFYGARLRPAQVGHLLSARA